MTGSDGRGPVGRRNVLRSLAAVGTTGIVGRSAADGRRATDDSVADERSVGGRYVEGISSTPGAPHPFENYHDDTVAVLEALYDGPGGAIDADTFLPLWFESFEVSDANDVVEYELRDDLVWGAGYGEFTAEDYLYTLENVVLLSGGDDWYGYVKTPEFVLAPTAEFVSYEKTGKYSIRAELPVSRAQWLHEDPLLETFPLPKGLLEKYVPAQDKEGLDGDTDVVEGLLSTGASTLGPYELDEHVRGEYWEFTRNEDYYLRDHADEEPFASDYYHDYSGSPYFEEYRLEVIHDRATLRAALDAGEIDGATVYDDSVGALRDDDDLTVWESQYGRSFSWLAVNHRINGWAPLREHRDVRKAAANLFDRTSVVGDAYEGLATPVATHHPPWGPFYPPAEDRYEPAGTVERARELLASGTGPDYGYDDDGRFVGPDGEQVRLTAVRTTGDPFVEAAGNYLADRFGRAGIDLRVEAYDFGTLLGDYMKNSVDNVDGASRDDLPAWADDDTFNGGPWDMAASSEDWALMLGVLNETEVYTPWGDVRSQWAERGTSNHIGYHQDEYDLFGVAADIANDPANAPERIRDVLGYLSRDLPVVWSHVNHEFQAFSTDVEGIPGAETDDGLVAIEDFHEPDPALLTFDAAPTGPADYANTAGVVDTPRLRAAIRDWSAGAIGDDLLRSVIGAWASGRQVV